MPAVIDIYGKNWDTKYSENYNRIIKMVFDYYQVFYVDLFKKFVGVEK